MRWPAWPGSCGNGFSERPFTFRVLVSQERAEPASPTAPLRVPRPVPGSDRRPGLRPGRWAPSPCPDQLPPKITRPGTAPPPEADAAPEHVLLPPHPLRLAAFLIDLALVAAVAAAATALTWSLAEFIVVLVVVWVIYQTGMVWLTGGRTVGKSACGLSVRHIDGSAPDPDLGWLRVGVRPRQRWLPARGHARSGRPGRAMQSPTALRARLRVRQPGRPGSRRHLRAWPGAHGPD